MFKLIKKTSLIIILFLISCTPVPVDPISQPVDHKYIQRGMKLVNGLAACGFCHGSNLSGRTVIDPEGAEILAPNLTQSSDPQIGTTYLFAAIKASAIEDSDIFSTSAHAGYEWMSDEDTLSIVAYLKLLDPVKRSDSQELDLTRNNSEFITDAISSVGYVPQINKNFQLAYGKYLVDHVARCQSCHNGEAGTFSDEEYLAGGKKIFKIDKQRDQVEISVPALKVSSWSQEQVVNYLKSNKKTSYCPTQYYSKAETADLIAIATYLKSLAG